MFRFTDTQGRAARNAKTEIGAARIVPSNIADAGKVRLGGYAPTLPPAIADTGKVRLGGYAPTLPPAPKRSG